MSAQNLNFRALLALCPHLLFSHLNYPTLYQVPHMSIPADGTLHCALFVEIQVVNLQILQLLQYYFFYCTVAQSSYQG